MDKETTEEVKGVVDYLNIEVETMSNWADAQIAHEGGVTRIEREVSEKCCKSKNRR